MTEHEAGDGGEILARLERLERLIGVSGSVAGSAVPRRAHQGHQESGAGPLPELGDWLKAHRKPGNVVVGIAVGMGGANSSAHHIFDGGQVEIDQRRVAGLCQALANETRLAMLRELFAGTRTTAELMQAVDLDRGQLYHHLRDLFIEGLVEQPQRGQYALTTKGQLVFLAVRLLPQLGPPVVVVPGMEPEPDLDQEGAPTPPPAAGS
ncbi:MAG TPA: winged helix-turn-helix domain-containing protein [Chloroflexota bacterium]|nr:winged helix-turn-helix domain-containing protein [Chloroflexota bacterium]